MKVSVPGYRHFGGKHWETAALKNTLAHAGVIASHTGQPFSEALCLGIAGGIAAGYSFCPSIPRYDVGSGVSVVGRYRAYATSAVFYEEFFERIGGTTTVKETGGIRAAYQNLVQGLEAGKPVVVWCAPTKITPLGWACTYGMYTMVVHGLDEEKGEAYLGDRAAGSLTIALADLSKARNRVCSHRNRTLTFDPPKKLTGKTLAAAVRGGIEACFEDFLQPKLKTYNLPGLLEWSKVVTSRKNKKGWLRVYPGGKLYAALRDLYDSIETAGTGGSLFRPLYADFLDEASQVLQRTALRDCALRYRQLGEMWSNLADAALPDKIQAFRRTKELLRKRSRLFEQRGAKAKRAIDGAGEELRNVEAEMRQAFALNQDNSTQLLENLRERITSLHEAESKAAQDLQKALD